MAAGVPLKAAVAGISCGLVTGDSDDDYIVLTDIQGLEDFFGDMILPDCDTLSAGKCADLIMIDLRQPNMRPINNITKNIVYSGSKSNVKMTIINGRILYRDGKFSVGTDPEEIYAKANAIISRTR